MSKTKYYAHSANAKSDWQPLKDHLKNVANLAKKFAEAARPNGNFIGCMTGVVDDEHEKF